MNTTAGKRLGRRVNRKEHKVWPICWAQATAVCIFCSTWCLAQSKVESLRICYRYNTERVYADTLKQTFWDAAFILLVEGKDSVSQVWDSVYARWEVHGLHPILDPPDSSPVYAFLPIDEGEGYVVSSFAGLACTLFVVSLPRPPPPPHQLSLYPNEGMPSLTSNPPFPPVTQAIEIKIGDTLHVVAKLFDVYGNWLSEHETDSVDIHWRLEDSFWSGNRSAGILTDTVGAATNLICAEASYTQQLLIATGPQSWLADTIVLLMRDTGYCGWHVVIEPTAEWQQNPNSENAIDTILLDITGSPTGVYAMLRDRFGNFVNYSDSTTWKSLDTLVATITAGISDSGQGFIRGIQTGITSVVAVNRALPVPWSIDTTVVVVTSGNTVLDPHASLGFRTFQVGPTAIRYPGATVYMKMEFYDLRGRCFISEEFPVGNPGPSAISAWESISNGCYLMCVSCLDTHRAVLRRLAIKVPGIR